MFPRFAASLIVVLLAITVSPLRADVVIQNGTAGQFAGTIAACGQSVHIPVGPSWDHIAFSFGEYDSGVPLASADATLYLLDQEYLRPAIELSSFTQGYVASTSVIRPFGGGAEWVFDTAVTLMPDTDYWFYMDKQTNEASPFMGVVSITAATYPDGNFYYSTPSSAGYLSDVGADLAFQLNGTAVPEPATGVLLLVATLGIVALRRRHAGLCRARK